MKSNSTPDGARNPHRTIFIFTLCGLLAVVSGSCSKHDQNGSPPKTAGPAEADPTQADPMAMPTCEFIKFDQADGNGRCADFKLTNESDRVIVGVRGRIVGYDSAGSEIYTFPWGVSALPHVVGARAEAVIENAGFEIPPEVERVEYEIEDIDLK